MSKVAYILLFIAWILASLNSFMWRKRAEELEQKYKRLYIDVKRLLDTLCRGAVQTMEGVERGS